MTRRIAWSLLVLLISACGSNGSREIPTLFVLPTITPTAQADPAGLLEYWEAASGTLENGADDRWHFVGHAGDQIILRVIGRGADASLTLQTESGRVLETGRSVEAQLPAKGIYTVIVQTVPGGSEGAYEIGLGYADRPNPDDVIPSPLPEVVGVPTPLPFYAELGSFISRLTNNNTVGGTMEDTVDHIYTFDGEADTYVQVEMNRVSGQIDPRLTIYDPEGAPIATDDDSGGGGAALLRNIRLPVDGLYSVQASGSGETGSYSIRLLNYEDRAPVTPTVVDVPTETPIPTFALPTLAPIASGNRLEDHIPVTNFVAQPGDVAIYPITLAAGEMVTIGAGPTENSAIRPEIEVSDPEGNIVASAQASASNAGGDALIAPLRAELEGTYRVFVTGEAGTTGPYIISYGRGSTWREILQGEAISGEAKEGAIERRATRHVWTLELRQGDIITATVNPAPGTAFDPILELVPAEDPNAPVAIDDNGGGGRTPLIRNVRIDETGLYLLRVKGARGATTGAYTLIWRYVNVAPTPTSPPAVALVLSLDDAVPESEYRFYPFQGRAGQRIQVHVTAGENSGFDPVAALVGPDGEVLVEADDTDGDLNPSFTYELPADGTYNVRVNGYLEGGPYEVVVEELF